MPFTPTGSVVSLDTLVQRVSSHLIENPNFIIVTLVGASTGSANATVDDSTKVDVGDLINVGRPGSGDGDEILLVKSITNATTIVVQRGMYGSTPLAATAVLSYINPRYPALQIEEAIKVIVDELTPDWAWQIKASTITLSDSASYYAAPSDFIDLVSAVQKKDPASTIPDYVKYGRAPYPLSIVDLPTADFANNTALYIPSHQNTVNDVTLFYRALLTSSTVLDGLMARCVEYGAVAHMMGMDQAQIGGETSPIVAVSNVTITNMQGASWYRRRYEEMRDLIRAKLLAQAPPAVTWQS